MSLEDGTENQNKVDQQLDTTLGPEGGHSKISKAARQKSLRERDSRNGIIQVNLRVPKEAAKFLKGFAEQLRKGKNLRALLMECAQRWPSPPPKPDQAAKPEKSPEQVKRDQRILFLGQRAYKLRSWRKVAMEIALGIWLKR